MNKGVISLLVVIFTAFNIHFCNAQNVENELDRKTVELFYQALNNNDTALVYRFIKEGTIPVNYKPAYKVYPILSTVWSKSCASMRVLVENGFKLPNEVIHYICSESIDVNVFNYLLSSMYEKKQIDISGWQNKFGNAYYPLHRLIVLYGLNFKEIIDDGYQRLNFYISAVDSREYEILDMLDFEDEALSLDTCHGYTVLTAAVRKNDIEMVKYLLSRGIDKEKREFEACNDDAQEGWSAYEIAKYKGYTEIMKLLE